MNHTNFLDLGYFKGGRFELATGAIHYIWPITYYDNYVTRPYGAIYSLCRELILFEISIKDMREMFINHQRLLYCNL